MHLYARTIGLSEISTKSAMDILLNKIVESAIQNNCVIYDLTKQKNQDIAMHYKNLINLLC